jgi:NADH dehydrogenase [ubiquinone] 1 alpha subcomplex assembly factor 6
MPFHAGVIRTSSPVEKTAKEGGDSPIKKSRGMAGPRSKRITLPAEYLFNHSVVEEQVYRKGAQAQGLKDAVFDTATRANDYIISARSILKEEFKGKVQASLYGPRLQLVASGKGWRLPWNMWKVGLKGNL